ncbi:hypothetical protein AVEN_25244-1 [Araneus ventricosus]|uniref:Uncharacterized protein n=1 Tax=Araneus ventricosus TaxID=182803 RepID=A0A4Y2T700_ARAVE|nr:hypothetical protein AVEN_25244-1 [Araneus ventricosus]
MGAEIIGGRLKIQGPHPFFNDFQGPNFIKNFSRILKDRGNPASRLQPPERAMLAYHQNDHRTVGAAVSGGLAGVYESSPPPRGVLRATLQ